MGTKLQARFKFHPTLTYISIIKKNGIIRSRFLSCNLQNYHAQKSKANLNIVQLGINLLVSQKFMQLLFTDISKTQRVLHFEEATTYYREQHSQSEHGIPIEHQQIYTKTLWKQGEISSFKMLQEKKRKIILFVPNVVISTTCARQLHKCSAFSGCFLAGRFLNIFY